MLHCGNTLSSRAAFSAGRRARKEPSVVEPRPAARGRLTEEQRIRVDIAHRELSHARGLDLVAMSPADLIRTVEDLRGSLHDALRVVSELAD
jgi:hypothetical protein